MTVFVLDEMQELDQKITPPPLPSPAAPGFRSAPPGRSGGPSAPSAPRADSSRDGAAGAPEFGLQTTVISSIMIGGQPNAASPPASTERWVETRETYDIAPGCAQAIAELSLVPGVCGNCLVTRKDPGNGLIQGRKGRSNANVPDLSAGSFPQSSANGPVAARTLNWHFAG